MSIFVCRATFFDYRDPSARRELAHSCWKIDMLVFHYEPENAASGTTAKTMKCLPSRTYQKGGCFLLMKRAERLEIRSGALQRKIRTDNIDDVVLSGDLFDCF